jgi:hypothetical protein
MAYRFTVGDRVKIKADNPGDRKRVPRYIMGLTGTVRAVHGVIVNPRDHREVRPPLYNVIIPLNQVSPRSTNKNDKIFVDVFEDWMIPEKGV